MYTLILIYLMYRFPSDKDDVSFKLLELLAKISWTLLIPLTLAMIVIKAIKKLFTTKDIDQAVDSVSKTMEVYNELSEYEWRNEKEVYNRLIEKRVKKQEDNQMSDVDLKNVVIDLLMGVNHFCKMRQETEEEFITRMVSENNTTPEHTPTSEDFESFEKLVKLYRLQFESITQNCKGDIFKEFYLGRGLLFLKINRGNTKKPTFEKTLQMKGV